MYRMGRAKGSGTALQPLRGSARPPSRAWLPSPRSEGKEGERRLTRRGGSPDRSSPGDLAFPDGRSGLFTITQGSLRIPCWSVNVAWPMIRFQSEEHEIGIASLCQTPRSYRKRSRLSKCTWAPLPPPEDSSRL